MKKLLLLAGIACAFSPGLLRAQTPAGSSGVYEELLLGVDPTQGTVTGYFEQNYEPPNLPYLHCSFYLAGKKQGDRYAIQAWSPGEKNPKLVSGQLTFFSTNPAKPSVLLKLEKLDRDCASIKPELAKDPGAYFDLKKSGSWTEVRMVAEKSPYYQTPELASPTRDSAKRGTVLTVTERQADWVQAQVRQKPKGWIRSADLYPTDPAQPIARVPAPVVEKTAPVTIAKPAETASPPPPPAPSTPDPESKAVLIERLRALDAQVFDMALQVLGNPAQRASLSAKRIEIEGGFNALVARLQQVAPAAYAEESKRIYETYLDLRYVEKDQAVVSLRLNRKIQESANR